jgi:putative endonuclease
LYVFCEVKSRSSTAFGAPIEAVNWEKQRRIRRLAAKWMAQSAARPRGDVRFDVASVLRGSIDVAEGCF